MLKYLGQCVFLYICIFTVFSALIPWCFSKSLFLDAHLPENLAKFSHCPPKSCHISKSLAIFPLRTVGILLVLTGHSLCCREIYIKGEVVWTQTDVWVRTQTGPAGHCPGCTFPNSRWVLRICVSPAWNYPLTTALWPNPRHMAPQDCFQKIIWLELNYFQ